MEGKGTSSILAGVGSDGKFRVLTAQEVSIILQPIVGFQFVTLITSACFQTNHNTIRLQHWLLQAKIRSLSLFRFLHQDVFGVDFFGVVFDMSSVDLKF